MTSVAPSKPVAVVFALLMLVPIVPVVNAGHTEPVVPDLPVLPHVRASPSCLAIGVPANVLQLVADPGSIFTGSGPGFALIDGALPGLCDPTTGAPLPGYASFIREADAILENFRNATRLAQRQADARLEHTLPGGSAEECSFLEATTGLREISELADPVDAPTLTCDLLRPRITLLADDFDRPRVGGFGEWTSVTSDGGESAFGVRVVEDREGQRASMRWGDDDGYERGRHEWLVSPEIDLAPVANVLGAAEYVEGQRALARNLLRNTCTAPIQFPPDEIRDAVPIFGGEGAAITLDEICGPNGEPTNILNDFFGGFGGELGSLVRTNALLLRAYEAAIDDAYANTPVVQRAAQLEITFHTNFEHTVDGVRVWVYSGDAPPTRAQLYSPSFGSGSVSAECIADDHVPDGLTTNDCAPECAYVRPTCTIDRDGYARPITDGHTERTNAFKDVPYGASDVAHTGLGRERTINVSLTEFAPGRVWVLFEVKTMPESNRAGQSTDRFADESIFPQQKEYGFSLESIRATAEGFHRNVRVKDVGAGLQRMPAGPPHNDPQSVLTTLPPGNEPVVVRVQNAGQYRENVSLVVRFERNIGTPASPVLMGAETVAVDVRDLLGSEVREVRVPWPSSLSEGDLVRVSAKVEAPTATTRLRVNAEHLTEPNNTAVRTPNVAQLNDDAVAAGDVRPFGASSTLAEAQVRAFTRHLLSAIAPPTSGRALEICSALNDKGACVPHYAGKRGEPRLLRLVVQNDGSVRENATAELVLERDGVATTGIVQGDAVQRLLRFDPGEQRTLVWTIVPTEPGVYTARVHLGLPELATPDAPVTTVERLIYVHRTTGTLCFDDLATRRECAPAFALESVDLLGVQDVTAMAFDADGLLYVATHVGPQQGGLYVRTPDGAWRLLEDLAQTRLAARGLAAPVPGPTFGPIRSLTFDPDGRLWLAGDNGTLLARTPTGALQSYALPARPAAPLAAIGGGDVEGVVNVTVPLAGGAIGGRAPYRFEWGVLGAPTGANATIGAPRSGASNLTADLPGTYTLSLNVTDAAGTVARRTVVVTLAPTPPPCDPAGGRIVVDGADIGGGRFDVLCVRARDDLRSTQGDREVTLYAELGGKPNPGETAQYWFRFTPVGATALPARVLRIQTDGTTATATWHDPATGRDVNPLTYVGPTAGFEGGSRIFGKFALEHVGLVSGQPARLDALSVESRACPEACAESGSVLRDSTSAGRYDIPSDTTPPEAITSVLIVPRDAQGTKAQLEWARPADDTGATAYVVERGTAVGGPFAIVGRTSALTFLDENLVPGTTYHYRVTPLDARQNAGTPSFPIAFTTGRFTSTLHATAWFNGTLWAAGTEGDLFFLNGTSLREVDLKYGPAASPSTYVSTLRALQVHNGRLFAAGDQGFVFHAGPASWRNATSANLTAAWSNATVPEAAAIRAPYHPVSEARGRDIRDLVVHADANGVSRLYAVGQGGLLMSLTTGTTFGRVAAPPSMGSADWVMGVPSHLGGLYLVDARSRFAACMPCGANPSWAQPEVPVPPDAASPLPRALPLVAAASTAGMTYVAGADGLLFALGDLSIHDHTGDWSTAQRLLSDRGVLQSRPGSSLDPSSGTEGAYRGVVAVNSAQDNSARSATQYQVVIRHHIRRASTTDGLELRVLSVDALPTTALATGTPQTCPGPSEAFLTPTRQSCLATYVGTVAFRKPHFLEQWHTETFTIPKNRTAVGLELYREDGAIWAIDSVELRGLVGGKWETIVRWDSLDATENVGTWYDPSVEYAAPRPHALVTLQDRSTPGAFIRLPDPHRLDPTSPWHVSYSLADRPVWVANDELWPHEPGGAAPRLRSEWDSRLVTPVIDLSEAYDPVIAFRHSYAFRMKAYAQGLDSAFYHPGDGGVLELQYEMTADECRSAGLVPPCWSPFYVVKPEGGYPDELRMFGTNAYKNLAIQETQQYSTTAGIIVGPKTENGASESFWGRIAHPNDNRIIDGVRNVAGSAYEDVRVVLSTTPGAPGAQKRCGPNDGPGSACLPTNVTGRNIRFGFRIVTHATSYSQDPLSDDTSGELQADLVFNHTNADQSTNPKSFAGEGWYIADFKVLGARQLGIDLRATNLTFRVGYDVGRIGVGPGTTVPVNVTVENRGVFDVGGYKGVLEVRRVVDPVRRLSVPVERIVLAQQPALDPGESQNHTLEWRVPTLENASYMLSFTVEPLGIDRDEDAGDNLARLGTLTAPVPARTHPDFKVELLVTPPAATSDITRYVPIYINNTGNVPLDGIVVRREIALLRLGATSQPERDTWRTDATVPAGTRMPLASLSSEVDAADDLFWKAAERSSYRFRVEAEGAGLSRGTDKLVAAFATYLFDDVEEGPRGESARGAWDFAPGWGEAEPGFLTQLSYGFGDVPTGRYPNDADASATLPTVDVSGARSATLAFYHRYKFEPGYDAGVVEASADGGRTWQPLTPIRDELNGLPFGYNRTTPLSAASVLHPTGDPRDAAYGFTGDSCDLPTAVDCWVLTQFDLTSVSAITERGLAYELHGPAQLGRLAAGDRLQRLANAEGKSGANDSRRFTADGGGWTIGNVEQERRWSFENLSSLDVQSVAGGPGLWWSGSASTYDDGVRPAANQLLVIPIDLSRVPADDPNIYVVDWWEWVERQDQAPVYYLSNGEFRPDFKDLRGAYTFHDNVQASQAYRFNVTLPNTLERRGSWYHMQADLTPWKGKPAFAIGFLYSPYMASGTGNLGSRYLEDRGFAIDGFELRSYRVVSGTPTDVRTVVSEAQAWASARVEECAKFAEQTQTTIYPCFQKTETTPIRLVPIHGRADVTATLKGKAGEGWSIVDRLPGVGAGWKVVPVDDEIPGTVAGVEPRAWYSGNPQCKAGATDCLLPGAESRLVTPAFDLGRVAGQDAQLTFTHRYAFPFKKSLEWRDPLASGGAVEIQVLDEQTGKWGEWQQLYAGSTAFCPGTRGLDFNKAPRAPSKTCGGGYTAYTVNDTPGSDGIARRLDSPFATVKGELERDVQYLYSGRSDKVPGSEQEWIRATFDVSQYLGRTVRFGFHLHMAGLPVSYTDSGSDKTTQAEVPYLLVDPDSENDGKIHKGGWWVKDVAIRGDVLKGAPLQLRMRAATDGNVDDGRWQVDDVGVFGSRYGRNVGVFFDQAPGALGVLSGGSTVVNLTLRNFGDTVRRNLAVEVSQTVPAAVLNLSGSAPGGIVYDTASSLQSLRFQGYTLAPGQSVTIPLVLRAPKDLPVSVQTLRVAVREFNANEGYAAIADNEVQGFLTRDMQVKIVRAGGLESLPPTVTPATPQPGETVSVRIAFRNTGYHPVTANLQCAAQLVTGHLEVNHKSTPSDLPEVAATVPCTTTGSFPTLAPGAWTNVTYRATPPQAGTLAFRITGNLVDNVDNATLAPIAATAFVGRSAVGLTEGFGRFEGFEAWSETLTAAPPGGVGETGPSVLPAHWDLLRGHREKGALGLGFNGSNGGGGYPMTTFESVSPPVDLHSFAPGQKVFLSFWHLDRLAAWDGANVKVQVLVDEANPRSPQAWTAPQPIRPIGGYEGSVRTLLPPEQSESPCNPPDTNPGWTPPGASCEPQTSPPDFFVTPRGPDGAPVYEDDWQLARFDLSTVTVEDTTKGGVHPVVGRTVRFVFSAYFGDADTCDPGDPSDPNAAPDQICRYAGEAFYVDDVTVGPYALDVRPDLQKGHLVDNTTKGFNLVVTNLGSGTDRYVVTYDEGNSSAPEGTVRPPPSAIEIPPGPPTRVQVGVTLPRDPSLLPTTYSARVHVRSVLDENSGGTADMAFQFAPRPWPELSVLAEAPRGATEEGTERFIPITAENNGVVASRATKVRIIDSFPGVPDVVTDVDLPAMSPGFVDREDSTRTLDFLWRPAKGTLGVHTLTIVVDPDGLMEEYSRANNVLVLRAEVAELLIPDLDVSRADALRLRNAVGALVPAAVDGDVTRHEVTAGEVVTFELRVRNNGRAPATNVDVRAFIGALSLPPKTLPYVAPGAEVAVAFNWLAQKDGSPYDLSFRLVSEQVEASTANNEHPAQGVTQLVVKGYEIAIDADAPTKVLSPGDKVQVPFRITNTGGAGEELLLRADAGGLVATMPRDAMFLRAGETYEAIATVTVPDDAVAGEHFMSILAVSRENPMKVASERVRVDVKAILGGRVVATEVDAAPPTFTLPVRLVNEGNSLEPWTVNARLPPGWTTREALPARVVVPAYGETTLLLSVTTGTATAPGAREVQVTATLPDGSRRDGVVTAEVRPLRTAQVDLASDAPRPTAGALAYPLVVENTGNTQMPFEMLLVGLPAGVEAKVSPSRFELAPGARTVATLLVSPTAAVPSGEHTVRAFTYFPGVNPDTAEGRANLQTLTVNVARPELRLGALDVAPRQGVEAGERVGVKVAVTNAGGATVGDVPVHLFADDVFIAETRIEALTAGERREVMVNWTAVPGEHTLTVVVDPYRDAVEADRADNAVSALAAVEGSLPAGISAGTSDVPAPPLWTLLAALGAAAVLSGTTRRRSAK